MAKQPASRDVRSLSLLLGLRLRGAQVRAGAAVNRELIRFCWQAGEDLAVLPKDPAARKRWVKFLSDTLALQAVQKQQFTPENMEAMCRFRKFWPDQAFVHDHLSELTWEHQLALLEVKQASRRKKLAQRALLEGWTAAKLRQEAGS